MSAKNDVTGDSIRSKPNNDNYRDNFDSIFGKKKSKESEEQAKEANRGVLQN